MASFAVRKSGMSSAPNPAGVLPGLVNQAVINAVGNVDTSPIINTISGVGNISGAYSLDLSAANITIVGTGTLTGDLAVTVTGLSDNGSIGIMTLVQDAAGSHAFSVIANGLTITPTVPTSGAFVVRLTSTDGNLFVEVTAALIGVASQLPMWTGTIAALVNGQLDTNVWPYQSVAAGHLTVLTDPLGSQGTVLEYAIAETG